MSGPTSKADTSKINYQRYLEDTIWCADRYYQQTVFNNSAWSSNGNSSNGDYLFEIAIKQYNAWYSVNNVPNVNCPNTTDRFSVGNNDAKLNYPVGLLTFDEYVMGGSSGNGDDIDLVNYLKTGGTSWIISGFGPSGSNYITWNLYREPIYIISDPDFYDGSGYPGLRPAISLKPGIEFVEGGDGTPTNPYVVKYE